MIKVSSPRVPLLIFLVLLCATLTPFSAAAADITRVGVIIPLSGNLAHLGSTIRDGFIFWKERHPDSKLEFVFEDDQFGDPPCGQDRGELHAGEWVAD